MADAEFYEALFKISDPWKVSEIKIDCTADRTDVRILEQSGVSRII
jgi:hypothetical protein